MNEERTGKWYIFMFICDTVNTLILTIFHGEFTGKPIQLDCVVSITYRLSDQSYLMKVIPWVGGCVNLTRNNEKCGFSSVVSNTFV